MKRASYRHAIKWIADNDEPTEMELERILSYISTLLVADIFGVDPNKVAEDVLTYRIF